MNNILAKIRVKEMHGIRRFLYPLSIPLADLPNIHGKSVHLVDSAGTIIPSETMSAVDGSTLEFAVSLAPQTSVNYDVVEGDAGVIVDDPVDLEFGEHGGMVNHQQRVEIEVSQRSDVLRCVYDGMSLLRQPMRIERVNSEIVLIPRSDCSGNSLTGWSQAIMIYDDGRSGAAQTDITACKSWAHQTLTLNDPSTTEAFHFDCDFDGGSETLIFDTGLGNGLYGKIGPLFSEIACCRCDMDSNTWEWCIGPGDPQSGQRRDDYIGTASNKDFQAQRWFHVVGADRAIAIAITKLPESCQKLTICLRTSGHITIDAYVVDPTGPIEFAVCAHFLNAVPAIAAATNPQSILLTPVVEVVEA